MNTKTNSNWPFGFENCSQCPNQRSMDASLCEKCGEVVRKRSKAAMWESVRNGTFDKSGELAADIKALHGNKPDTGFGNIDET